MGEATTTGRPRQRLRTRKDLLEAAGRLVKRGRKPTLDEVADEALVSRATAYRYFPNVEALLIETSLDIAMPDPAEVFQGAAPADPTERLEQLDDAFDKALIPNQIPLRLMLANALNQRAAGNGAGELPVRQNRRTPLIEAALAPARKQFKPADYEKLTAALALVFGTESLIVFHDVLQLSEAEARKVRHFAIRALVEAAKKSA